MTEPNSHKCPDCGGPTRPAPGKSGQEGVRVCNHHHYSKVPPTNATSTVTCPHCKGAIRLTVRGAT